MQDKNRLVDDILEEISAHRSASQDKNVGRRVLGTDALVDSILAEAAYKQIPKDETASVKAEVQSQPVASEKTIDKPVPEKKTKEKKTKPKKNEEDLLASITPWEERHAAHRGITPQEAERVTKENTSIDTMTGVKNTQSFFQSLKKSKNNAVPQKEELLYKNGSSVHPVAEEPAVKEAGALEDVSTKELQETVETATKQMENTYEPTRMVSVVEKTTSQTVEEKTTHFRPRIQPDEITGQVRLEGFDKPEEPAQPEEWESDFVSGREDKVKRFKMTKPGEEADERPASHEEDGEYHTVKDASPIKYDLLTRCRNVTARFWVSVVLFLVCLALTFVDTVDFTNDLLRDNPALLLGLYVFVLATALVMNVGIFWGGLKAIFSGCDQDTPAALGLTVALVQSGVMFAMLGNLPDGFASMLVGAPALLGLSLNLWGKRLMFMRLYRNMELIGNERVKQAVTMVKNKEEAFELGRGLAVGTPNVVFSRGGVNLKDFVYHSYAPDGAELSARLPMALFPLFGIIGGVLAFLMGNHSSIVHGVLNTVSGFAGGVCISLPFCVLLAGNVPFSRFCRHLFRRRVMISGYDAVEEFKDTDVVVLDASQLFPAGSVTLKSIKSASNQSLDRSIMDVAGVVYMADCPLKPLFETIIQGKTNLLPEVDTLVYEEELGISGWVMGYRVLVGTRKLMETHGVTIPDDDYEEKYSESGLKAVYLSTQGILSAVFLVKYAPDPSVTEALHRAVDDGLSLHIYSCDPNVTREMVCRMFHLPAGAVRIMGAVPRRLYKQQIETEEAPEAVLSYEGDAGDFCRGISAVKKLHKVIRFASVIQTIMVIVGIVLLGAMIYLSGAAGISGGLILLYHLAATLLILGLPLLLGR